MIYRYFSILLATALVLGGLQVPGFINQYQQRVSAHLSEVSANLAGFQRIADQLHGGSLLALIEKHRRSPDATFSAEGDVIESMVFRRDRFRAELESLETSLFARIEHVVTAGDRELMSETVAEYKYVITLDQDSAICAGIMLVLGILLADLLHLLLARIFRRRQPA